MQTTISYSRLSYIWSPLLWSGEELAHEVVIQSSLTIMAAAGTVGNDYVHHFWGEKHHGFHVLYENMKHGEESVNEIGHFIKERLAMEEEYGKMFAKSINRDLAKEVAKYKESLARARKDAKQQDIIDAVNLMQTTTTCLQKVESKMLKSREEYRSYVEKYELVRLNFEEKMERACKMFQSHDRSHFAALQQFLIMYAVHQQEATTAAQQVSGQFRESLQMLNVDEMMARFVHEKGTGSERPQAAVFEEPSETYAILDEDVHRLQIGSIPSLSNGSEIISLNPTIPTADELLSLEQLNACTGSRETFKAQICFVYPLLIEPHPDLQCRSDYKGVFSTDDVHSTTSSTKSDDKRTNGSVNLLDLPLAPPPPASVDDEGYTIREKENDKEDTNWSSCSSSDEDENTLQRSKIRSLTIRPVDSTRPLNASVDELRDAIGHIKSEFGRSNAPLNFSASMGPVTGIARARPRSNTPTYNSAFGVSNVLQKATISEHRVPIAMAINEYSHVWFKSANVNERVTRTFGTVLISFPASSLPLLTDMHSDIEPLQFTLIDAEMVKSVLPNKQLLLPRSVRSQHDPNYCYQLDRLGLANWLLTQHKEKPAAAFFNAELVRGAVSDCQRRSAAPTDRIIGDVLEGKVVRYELCDDERVTQPPLLMTTYWKCEEDHTDVRIDYHLNTECSITAPLLNLTFNTKLSGNVNNVTSEPPAIWSAENSSLTWIVTELSRYGDCAGSLKARAHLASDGPSNAAHAHVQFQCSDATISGVNVALMSSDTYHISMVRRKVMAGKYFCEPEIRK
ncbi:unnamed protein product [Angiostrongylus costaricensis]|uniref:MHD domain-containing protein n=1 Tax=Angiostrongylus costaricensis TaxID=334426 RepID=A0A0R3PN56_ANGCS|nr:unnamed protein product [Angiostrongylus costaricensis]